MVLVAPRGMDTRPTTDRIKETLFNVLQGEVPGSVFVDLFAGSGAIGIEAISRGAKKAIFVENGKDAISCIEQNLSHTHFTDRAQVLRQDAISALAYQIKETADIIFADPPYQCGFPEKILAAAANSNAVGADTLLVIEEDKNTDFSFAESYGFTVWKEKVYKSNKHVFLYKKGNE